MPVEHSFSLVLPLTVVKFAMSSCVRLTYMANNVPFGVETFISNFIQSFPLGLINSNAWASPPSDHPCSNLFEMLNKLKAQSGTSAMFVILTGNT